MSVRNYTEALAKVKAVREVARKEAAEAVIGGFKEIFAAYPKLQTIGWSQYSPYFNDGGECVFSARTESYSLFINGSRSDYGEDYEEGQELDAIEHETIADEVAKFLQMFEDEDLKALYGNHVRVTISRDGSATTDEYSHD